MNTFSRSSVIVFSARILAAHATESVWLQRDDEVILAQLPSAQHFFQEDETHYDPSYLVEAYGNHGPFQVDYL